MNDPQTLPQLTETRVTYMHLTWGWNVQIWWRGRGYHL